ncbi:MAG TPA: hypothetical protein VE398_25405, partial [Acidobacteriota bacterium]|nr:hypothetical protein [Acidobacteriota bacterium]
MARDTVGRTFIEIGADMSPLIRDIDSAVKIMGETEAKLISQGRRIGTAFENAYNPAGKLEKQLAALGTQGRSSADIVKVYGDRIVSATDASIKHGATLTPLMQNYRNLALATEKTSDAMWQQRGAAQMLEGYLGVHLPKSVNTFLAKSEIIGPMLGAAFSATAIVALGGAVFELGRKFADSMGWIGKSAEEMDKARKEAEKFSESLTKAANEYARIGLSGSALKGVEAGQAATAAAAARQELESTRALITAAAERVRNPQWNIQPGQPLQIPTQAAMAAAEALKNLGITDENREARLQELLEKHMQTQGELNKLKKEAAVDTEKESIANLEKQLDLTLKTKTESEGWNLIISAQAKIWSETVQPELKAYAERQSELLKTQEALNKASEDFAKIQPRKDQELEFQIEAGLRWSKLVGKDQQKILDDQEKAGLQAIDRIRDSAGHIFDDLMTGSKNIFQDLLRTFE